MEPLEPSDYRAAHVGCDTDFEDPEEQSKDERKQSGAGWQKDANDVFMEAGNGDVMQFAWIVEKVIEGRYRDCWMTVAVSAPQLSGQGS